MIPDSWRRGRIMMTSEQVECVRASYKALALRGEELAEQFFTRLLSKQPMLRAILPRDQWQRTHELMGGLGMIVKGLGRIESVEGMLMEFGARAQRAGVMPQHYGVAREALVETLRDLSGPGWTREHEESWRIALNTVTSLVLLGAGRARARAA